MTEIISPEEAFYASNNMPMSRRSGGGGSQGGMTYIPDPSGGIHGGWWVPTIKLPFGWAPGMPSRFDDDKPLKYGAITGGDTPFGGVDLSSGRVKSKKEIDTAEQIVTGLMKAGLLSIPLIASGGAAAPVVSEVEMSDLAASEGVPLLEEEGSLLSNRGYGAVERAIVEGRVNSLRGSVTPMRSGPMVDIELTPRTPVTPIGAQYGRVYTPLRGGGVMGVSPRTSWLGRLRPRGFDNRVIVLEPSEFGLDNFV